MNNIKLLHGDCLELMKNIPDKSIDMILCDLPYGTTACKWDVVIPFEPLWKEYKRIIKDRGCIALFGSEPFSSHLRMSNIKNYKYDWIWVKTRPGGFVSAKLKPLKNIENIIIFSKANTANRCKNNMQYFPQGVEEGFEWSRPRKYNKKDTGYARNSQQLKRKLDGSNYPRQTLNFKNPNKNVVHPTQKPVALLEYLIKTYTLENETVLDNCMGSGSTGVACINTNRKFIGIEKDDKYFDIAKKRIDNTIQEQKEKLFT